MDYGVKCHSGWVGVSASSHRASSVARRVSSCAMASRNASLPGCARAAMMCRGLTSLGGSEGAGGTFSASTAFWPTAGRCRTIRAVHPDYWRKVREGENANEGKPTAELCRRSRACLAPCGEGCAEDCAYVRHAALRVGKRQGCGDEAVRLCHRTPPPMQSNIRCKTEGAR